MTVTPVPKDIKEWVAEWGPTIGVVGDVSGAFSAAYTIAILIGAIDDPQEEMMKQLNSRLDVIERQIKQILTILTQQENVRLVGPVNAVRDKCAKFLTVAETSRRSFGSGIASAIIDNDRALEVATSNARTNRDWDRVVMLSKLRYDNFCYNQIFVCLDASTEKPAFASFDDKPKLAKLRQNLLVELDNAFRKIMPYEFDTFGGRSWVYVATMKLPRKVVTIGPPPHGGKITKTKEGIFIKDNGNTPLDQATVKKIKDESENKYDDIIQQMVDQSDADMMPDDGAIEIAKQFESKAETVSQQFGLN